jgi:hypothetical protein
MPINRQNNLIMFSQCPDEYWVNIVEKAIFMLYGGQSLSLKSNPSYEIYHLTGWIPEVVLFEDISNKSNLWQRLYSNFTDGNIMVCLGTGLIKDPFIQANEAVLSRTSSI